MSSKGDRCTEIHEQWGIGINRTYGCSVVAPLACGESATDSPTALALNDGEILLRLSIVTA